MKNLIEKNLRQGEQRPKRGASVLAKRFLAKNQRGLQKFRKKSPSVKKTRMGNPSLYIASNKKIGLVRDPNPHPPDSQDRRQA